MDETVVDEQGEICPDDVRPESNRVRVKRRSSGREQLRPPLSSVKTTVVALNDHDVGNSHDAQASRIPVKIEPKIRQKLRKAKSWGPQTILEMEKCQELSGSEEAIFAGDSFDSSIALSITENGRLFSQSSHGNTHGASVFSSRPPSGPFSPTAALEDSDIPQIRTHSIPGGKGNSLERLSDLPDYYNAKRGRSIRLPSSTSSLASGVSRISASNSLASGVSRVSQNSHNTSNSSMPSLSSFGEHDISSVGNVSITTAGTNYSGEESVVTAGANSIVSAESAVHSVSSSVDGTVAEQSSERPIILSIIPPPDERRVGQSKSYSSAIVRSSLSTTPGNKRPSSRVVHPSATMGRPNQAIQRSSLPIVADVIVKTDLQYGLEGTTLDILGPNIANPHKNKPQARWESVSQTKKSLPVTKAAPGNEYVAPLTHDQKNLLPTKKDAVPMYRRPRSYSDPSSPVDSASGKRSINTVGSGFQSKELGEMWKTMLLEPTPTVQDIGLGDKDRRPMAVTRNDSFGELPSEGTLARARRSNSDNDIILIEELSPIIARRSWRDDIDTSQNALIPSRSNDILFPTSPTHTWEYEPATTTSTVSSGHDEGKQRSISRRKSGSISRRSSRKSDDAISKGMDATTVASHVSNPPMPPPPPLLLRRLSVTTTTSRQVVEDKPRSSSHRRSSSHSRRSMNRSTDPIKTVDRVSETRLPAPPPSIPFPI